MLPAITLWAGGPSVGTYGLFAVIGVSISFVLAIRAARRQGLPSRLVFDLLLWIVILALVGARATQLLIELASPPAALPPGTPPLGSWRGLATLLFASPGGLSFVGGLMGAAAAFILYTRRHPELPPRPTFDSLVLAAGPGLAWGWMGCFLAGVCWGRAGGGELAVHAVPGSYVHDVHAALGLLPSPSAPTYGLHPVQLYMAGFLILLSGAATVLSARRRWSGRLAIGWLLALSVALFVLDVYRGDRSRGFLGAPAAMPELNWWLGVDGGSPTVLSVPQAGAIALFFGALIVGFAFKNVPARSGR